MTPTERAKDILYKRTVHSLDGQRFESDIYRICAAYGASIPIAHAVKKLLVAGQRGHKGKVQDLQEAIQAIEEEIKMTGGEG